MSTASVLLAVAFYTVIGRPLIRWADRHNPFEPRRAGTPPGGEGL